MMKNKQDKHKNIKLLAKSSFMVSQQSNPSECKTPVLQKIILHNLLYLLMIK